MDESKSMEGVMQADALASLNHCTYELEPAVSVATSRTMREYLASNDRHYLGEDPVHITVASGNSFVDLRSSTLTYDIHFENMSDDEVRNTRMPQGASFLNMWDGFRLTHATGVLVDSMTTSLGVWRQINTWWNRSSEWRDTIGSGLLGMANKFARPFDNVDERVGDYVNELHQRDRPARNADELKDGKKKIEAKARHVCIPLPELFDWADKDELAPPYLMSGLQIDLTSLRKERFFIRPSDQKTYIGDASSEEGEQYKFNTVAFRHDVEPNEWPAGSRVYIDNIRLNLCSYSLTDSMSDYIAKKSASEGLQWAWTAVVNTSTTNTEEVFTMPISQSLSRANAFIVKARLASRLDNFFTNHTASLPWLPDEDRSASARHSTNLDTSSVIDTPNHDIDGTCLEMQARVGAMYLPSSALGNGGVKQFYHSALQCFSAFRRHDAQIGPTLSEFAGEIMNPGVKYQTATAATADDQITYMDPTQFDKGEQMYPAITTAAQGLYAIPLETSPDLAQAGIALSSQRSGEISLRFKPMSGKQRPRRYDLFVPHTRVASLFLGDVCVVRN
jgi:hypothetical protein